MNSSFLESSELERRERRRLRRDREGSPCGRWSSLAGSELLGFWFSFPDCAATGVGEGSWFMASLMSSVGYSFGANDDVPDMLAFRDWGNMARAVPCAASFVTLKLTPTGLVRAMT